MIDPSTWTGRLLIIDAYDSYIHNIYALVAALLPRAQILLLPHDRLDVSALTALCHAADACILGPGPGNPARMEDIGCFPWFWSLPPALQLPTLGICLGMQTLSLHFGARLHRLSLPAHGICSDIRPAEDDLFNGQTALRVVRYHSFAVQPDAASTLRPLAWAEDLANGPVLMAVRHITKPFYGLQYHPESVLSTGGTKTLYNFWRLACKYNRRNRTVDATDVLIVPNRAFSTLFDKLFSGTFDKTLGTAVTKLEKALFVRRLTYITLNNCTLSVPDVVEALSLHYCAWSALLESVTMGQGVKQNTGRYTILGAPSEGHYVLTYTFPKKYIVKTYADREEHVFLETEDAWTWLKRECQRYRILDGPTVPFWGGFIGYVSYEYGVYMAGFNNTIQQRSYPDINMLFFERSLVIDTEKNQVVIQSLIDYDPWVAKTVTILKSINTGQVGVRNADQSTLIIQQKDCSFNCDATICNINKSIHNDLSSCSTQKHITRIVLPKKKEYLSKIYTAQDYITNGESYQLCLTTTIRVFSSNPCTPLDDWNLYKRLRTLNPAPFCGYLRLNNLTFLSSSPERFLSWSRDGLCEMRPIKGTIRKDSSINFEKAKIMFKDPKYFGENLMILDLIRNDLYRITKNVQVPALMQVEEYKTLYQLVSVVQGILNPPLTGIDVLGYTLPPGSMTGAPKKRSVELLNKLEKNERNIFSGVFGYFSICGGGDWSVIIRSTFRYHNEDHWNIGAGGAITILSDPENEWDEMILKLQSILPLFTTDEHIC